MACSMQLNARQAAGAARSAARQRAQCPTRLMQRVMCQAPVGTVTAAPPASASSKPQLVQRHQRLRDPAQIGAQGSSTVNVQDMSYTVTNSSGVQEDISLYAYMRLPVEQ